MKRALSTFILAALAPIAHAAPPGIINHQGRIAVGGINFDGTGHFKFALVDGAGTTSFWSNDGTSNGGGEPTSSIAVPVNRGQYAVALGETNAIPASVFADSEDVRLRVWFSQSGGAGTFEQLAPDRRLTSAGYALSAQQAQRVPDGAITAAMLGEGAVGSDQLADGAVSLPKLATIAAARLEATVNNPSPGSGDNFGFAVAGVGADKLLVGAPLDDTGANGSGSAYLFDLSGNLLVALDNPTPESFDNFGLAVASVGADKLLVGAPSDDTGALGSGSAYLFDLSGNLLVALDNPSPGVGDNFGFAVAGVGADKLLVGAPFEDSGALRSGSAYLFDLSGNLLVTLDNPSPGSSDNFGFAVAGVGADKLLVGAPLDDTGATNSGSAYLFDLSGNLLVTLDNPSPGSGDQFGLAVAGVGADELLVAAPFDDTGANSSGLAYLFDLSGSRLATLRNPSPGSGDQFGRSVAGVGADKLLVGAPFEDSGATDSGSAYLFDLTGNLLATLRSPSPGSGDQFGRSVAGVGADKLLVGAPAEDSGATNSGSAYLSEIGGAVEGLVALEVVDRSLTAGSFATGAVTSEAIANGTIAAADVDGSSIGLWDVSGADVFRPAGAVGIGTSNPQSALHVEGDALFSGDSRAIGSSTATEHKFPAPRTFTHNISASGFVPDTPSEGYDRGSGLISPSGDTSLQFHAPVHLPEGATVTGVFFDNGNPERFTDIDLRLRYFRNSDLGSVIMAEFLNQATSAAFASGKVTFDHTGGITDPVIDNANRTYSLDVKIDVAAPANSDTRFYGVRIEYTLQTLLP